MPKKSAQAVMPRFFIRTQSWHYRYFLWIRSFWGAADPPSKTSLCPYCQTILWGTIIGLVASPGLIVGYLLIKGTMRLLDKLDKYEFEKTYDFVASSPVGKLVSDDGKAANGRVNNALTPLFTLFFYAIAILFGAVVIGVAAGMIFMFCWGVYELVVNFPWLVERGAHYVWQGLIWAGWTVFMFFYIVADIAVMIYDLVIAAGKWIGWLFTRKATLITIGCLVCCFAVVLLYMKYIDKILNSKIVLAMGKKTDSVFEKIADKFAAWQEKRRQKKIEQIKAEREAERERERLADERGEWFEPEEQEARGTPIMVVAWGGLSKGVVATGKGIAWTWGKTVGSVREKVTVGKDASVSVLGFFGIIGLFLWSAKKRACPTIEFISDEMIATVKGISEQSLETKPEIKHLHQYQKIKRWLEEGEDQRLKKDIVYRCFSESDDVDVNNYDNLKAPGPAAAVLGQYVLDQITYKMLIKKIDTIISGIVAKEKLHHHQNVASEVGKLLEDAGRLDKIKEERA